jgi:hypothetical protein
MKFGSRTGARPFTTKRAAGNAPPVAATAEFGALLRIMQDANLDLLGQFYGGARLTYDESVSQKIITDVGRRVATKADANMGDSRAAEVVRKIATKIATRVAREESQYVIDNVSAQAVGYATDELTDVIKGSSTKSIPIVGLLVTGYDALKQDLDALDKVIRAVCASRHATKVRAGSPRAAAEAVGKIMKRKSVFAGVGGASSTGAFAVGIAAEVGSFGAAVGTAEAATAAFQAFIEIIIWLVEMVIDIMDYMRGTALLNDLPAIVNPTQQTFMKLFNDCPILGCYMLATPIFPTSAFVWLVTTQGNVSSVDEIERVAIGHVNPLRLEASWIIANATFSMKNPENPSVDNELTKAIKASAADADKRSAALDKSLGQKLIDYATEGRGNHMPGFGVVGAGGIGTHNYNGHEGKLHGLSSRLKKFKKTTKNKFVNQTMVGRYLRGIGAVKA